ncbi:MAG: amidohydrolase [Clostridia bacterium]|nr:amidohydrolase [Clostridia bacterium]
MIIDVHTHIFPDKIAARAVSALAAAANIEPNTNGTADATLCLMDNAGVDKAILVSVATKPEQMRTINDFLNTKPKDRFVPFGAIYPVTENGCRQILEEVEYISSLGYKGVKLHPEYQGFYPDDEKLFPFYDLCSSLNIAITFHAGEDIGFKPPYHGLPSNFEALAKTFPKLKIICAHFGGWKCWSEVEERLSIHPNVYYDTAFCSKYLDREVAKRLISKKGVDNIMLGSDVPWEDPKDSIRFIDSLRIREHEKESILGANAKRIFRL